jgi:hypothetical protein
MIYEILIRGNKDGTLAGAHAIDWENGAPSRVARPIQEGDWPEVASAVNAVVLEENESLRAAAQKAAEEKEAALAELDETRALAAEIINQARAALVDGNFSEEERTALLLSLVERAAMPSRERRRAELEQKKRELEEQLAAME